MMAFDGAIAPMHGPLLLVRALPGILGWRVDIVVEPSGDAVVFAP